MVNKFKSVLEKHKYSISIFVFFFIYNFAVIGDFSFPKIDIATYTFHIVDYSVGFCTKLLPGAIYNAFFPTTNQDTVNLYFFVLYHIFLLCVCFMLEKFIYRFESKNRHIALIIVLFFITGPATFSIHVVEFGMLDTYWLFFSTAFLAMVQNKYLKWFVPIIFILSILIHISSMVSFIPFFALVLLLEASRSEESRKSYIVILAVSVFLSVGTFVYFMLYETSNLLLSFEDFKSLISERNLSEWDDYTYYYAYSLYKIMPSGTQAVNSALEYGSSFVAQAFGLVCVQIKEIVSLYPIILEKYWTDTVNAIFLLLPIIVLMYKYVLSSLKKERTNKLRRFVWFCTIFLLPMTFVATAALFSTDMIRWFGHGIMLLFVLVMYEIYRSSDNDCLESLSNLFDNTSYFAVVVYFVLYMACTVAPYS